MATLSVFPKFRALDSNGDPLAGGKLFSYEAGTSTPLATYTTQAAATANANPVILDANGEADVWLLKRSYKLVLKDSADVQQWEVDNIFGSQEDGIHVVATVAALTALTVQVSTVLYRTLGYTTAGDGGHGIYRWNSSDTTAANAGTVLQPDSAPATGRFNLIHNGEVALEQFGSTGDGVALDDTALSGAIALGLPITLRNDKTYFFSSGVDAVTGSHLVCNDGKATIKLKTGSGGFNVKNVGGTRTDTDRCFFSCDGVDDVGIEGVRFTTDGTADVVIYPIRTSEGLGTKGAEFRRIEFVGFAVGEMIGINSAGEGAYVIEDIYGLDCGTANGNTYWTGSAQWTLVALDNDVISSVYSEPGYISDLKVKDCLFTSTALTDFGQETDCFNHVGMDSDAQGPTVIGIDANGIGEVVDIFGSYTVVKGIRAQNAQIYVAKLIHGAQHCRVEIDSVESCGHVLGLWGSASSADDTQYNSVHIGTVKGVGTVGTQTDPAVVTIGGAASTKKPKFNVVTVDRVLGNASMEYVVRDGGADNDLGNFVDVKFATAWNTGFCDGPADNVTVRYQNQREIRAVIGTNQNLTTATPTTVEYNTSEQDSLSEFTAGTFTIRPATPGRKLVHGQVRVNPDAAGDTLSLSILQNAVTVAGPSLTVFHDATGGQIHEISKVIYIQESDAGKAAADLIVQATATHSGTFTLVNTANASYFEVIDL